ncbi:SacI homology domain-containing protein [Lophiotrema nucula]|uniref:SacI homology domain-containing protein n=1 Tax=Lophiotrema nucula TaxID=690887 RepID=A0A6A5ZP20_9PLEO|nr:SacI homology domain-containing protein [Lophiotrema nucula]
MSALSSSPEPLRKANESASQSTDDGSTRLTPDEDEDDLPMIGEDDTYKLKPIASRDHLGVPDDGQGEGAGLLPSPRRFSLGSVQSFELYTPDEERTVLRKLDRRLVGFMALLYCLSFLDRSNIGNARIAGLARDLKLNSDQYEWLLWAFYISYIAFEWMTLMYRIVPPHIYISLCILSWGIIASIQALATSFSFLLVLRFLLGVGEAAFGPGVPFYLSFFFRRNELAFRTGLFISASPLSASFAGALAWLITKVGEHGPLSPWRLLFLIEGFPSVLIAVWAWEFIPDGPGSAKWLTPRQREVAILRLRQEKESDEEDLLGEKHTSSASGRRGVNFREVLQALKDPNCYLTAFMFFSCNIAFSSMPVFLPTIIRDMGHSSLTAQALSAPPYLFSFVVVIATAYISDKYQTRSTAIIFHSILATLGYTTIALSGYYASTNTTIKYLALYPAAAGFFSCITIIITWTINNQESDSKKGTGMAILNVIGQCGPLVGTSIFPEEDGPFYVKGMSLCALFMLFVGILATILRFVLKAQNKRIQRELSSGEYAGIPLQEGEQSQILEDLREYVFALLVVKEDWSGLVRLESDPMLSLMTCALTHAKTGIMAPKRASATPFTTFRLRETLSMESSKSRPPAEVDERPSSIASKATPVESQDSDQEKDTADSDRTSIGTESAVTTINNEAPVNTFKPEADLEKAPGLPRGETESMKFDGEDEEPVPTSFQRSSSPGVMKRNKNAGYGKVGEDSILRMHKYSLYETSTRFYLIGTDVMDRHYRLLKIDRTAPPGHLNIFEDDIVYDKREMDQLLNAIDDGNKATGGIKLKVTSWGLLGFIRFTEAYYMLLVTKRAQVAMLGGHYIYQVDGTELIPLTTGSSSRFQKDRNPEEARFLNILSNLDLTRSFYFSYSYNITRSLQQNIIRERTALNEGLQKPKEDFQDMFAWNNHLLAPARTALRNVYDWCHPIIHGYVDQATLDVFGRRVFITIIARRSRFFAGARFLKRGANDLGYVANDVETEQILSEALTTSFHAPGPRLFASPTYTSYVQHRGSIPLYWTQDNTGVTPKPDIDVNLIDPFFSASALHFDDLFKRYGAPIYVLNLIKARERTPRESKLLSEYQNAIKYLNQSLPEDKKILYEAFDMARASKTRGQDVIGTLENLAEKVLRKTGFFHNGDSNFDEPQVQNGVARTNCIDCLDRTNACQFVVGKRALGRQLQALGVISKNTVDYDSDCVDIFTHMFHGHGDAIAIQYGGSHLVNTMATYRKLNHWQSSSRDMVESFKRYYHNSFLDSQRQEAYNLFLGNYIFAQGQPMLWDLTTDYYLHHEDPRSWLNKERRNYISWYTPSHLELRTLPPAVNTETRPNEVSEHDDYWLEYYRPLAISSFLKIFIFRLNSPARQPQEKVFPPRDQNVSPFVVRKKQQDQESPSKNTKKAGRKLVTIVDPSSETESKRKESGWTHRRRDLHLQVPDNGSPMKQSILLNSPYEPYMPNSAPPVGGHYPRLTTSISASTGWSSSTSRNFKPADKALQTQWTLGQFYDNSLNPSVTVAEEDEYQRYIEHPLNLPLVVSTEAPSADDPSALEFHEYLHKHEEAAKQEETAHRDSDAFSLRPGTANTYFEKADRATRDADNTSIRSNYSRPTSAAGFSINIPFSHHHTPSYPSISHSHSTSTSSHLTHASNVRHPQFVDQDFAIPDEVVDPLAEEFGEYLKVADNPLDVLEDDGGKKRYKAYRQWLKGKSFFKQSKVDPEWREAGMLGR